MAVKSYYSASSLRDDFDYFERNRLSHSKWDILFVQDTALEMTLRINDVRDDTVNIGMLFPREDCLETRLFF